MLQPIEAQVIDARHLELRDPIRLRPGSQVVITILEAADSAEIPGLASACRPWPRRCLQRERTRPILSP